MRRRNLFIKGISLILGVVMALSCIMPDGIKGDNTVHAANTGVQGSDKFIDVSELNKTDTAYGLYGSDKKIQKVYFGTNGDDKQTWYIAGYDGTGLVLMCDPAKPLADCQAFNSSKDEITDISKIKGDYDSGTAPTSVYANHYGSSDLRAWLTSKKVNDKNAGLSFFTVSEESLMLSATVYTNDMKNNSIYSTNDKLYAAYGDYTDYNCITVGSNSADNLNCGIKIGLTSDTAPSDSPYTSCRWFWLRLPDNYDRYAFFADPGFKVNSNGVTIELEVLPAFNLNLSSVLFASAAQAATADAELTDAVTFRFDGSDKIASAVDFTANEVTVKKDSSDKSLFLYVQGNDWVYSKKITSSETIDVNTIKSGADLSYCKIWLETTIDNVTYAKEPIKVIPEIGFLLFGTK